MTSAASKKVGSTSLSLPAFGFGSAHLGELYAKVDEADSRATMDAAWAAGVRYYDTAPWYGRGLSEHRLGGFLRTKPRAEFKISTKVGRTLHRPKDPATFDRSPWTGGFNFGYSLTVNSCNCPLNEQENEFQWVGNTTRIIGNRTKCINS